ncbi:uncharacterized protein LOC110988475 [Acanthaster planci]|uniref:Uncharacterized protein LOC110988475 n=1 Tax=Acanthaster planci TaxID=133434 RepID=A0A8B7ZQL2_ACAPL|nr:uncharacterized protein LOC110988475 [Acanthaster planci]
MSASSASALILFALGLHLGGVEANHSVQGLVASPVDGDPLALNVTWRYPTAGRLVLEHGTPRYFSISYSWADRYGCHTVLNASDNSNRHLVEMIHRSDTQDRGLYLLTGLQPNSGYNVYVQANTLSYAFPESSTYARTGQKVPKDAPTGVMLVRAESNMTSLKFVWDNVPCTAGSRSSRFLGYRYNLTWDDFTAGITSETKVAGVLVTDLEPYTRYGFRVQFKSEKGLGPYSEPFNAVTMGKVTLIQASEVATGETVELVCSSRGGGLRSSPIPGPHSLVLTGSDGDVHRSSTTVSGRTRTNHFRVLVDRNDMEFTCTLHYDGVDEVVGRKALRVIVYEKPYLRTPPTARIRDPAPGNATVTWLSWTADGGGDGPVDYQEVVWRRVGDITFDNMPVRSGSVSAVVTGLEPDAEYEFAVVLFRKGVPGPPNKAILVGNPPAATMATSSSEENAGKPKKGGFRNRFGPETDNAIIAGVCGFYLTVLVLLTAFGIWCSNTKEESSSDEVPLTKDEK